MPIFTAIIFTLIIISLGLALYFMMHDRGKTRRMAIALAIRVGLSIGLFISILVAYRMGWILR